MRSATALVLTTILAAATLGCASARPAATKPPTLQERWGVELNGIRPSAAGYMLDFRFTVLDTEKAAPLFDRATKPYLMDQVTGAKFLVPNPPKTGPLRTSDPPHLGRRYFIFFANPGKFIQSGEKVTVVIGDFRVADLVVQ